MDELTEKRWDKLIDKLSSQFADGDKITQEAILFLIGVQELGKGYKKFAKRDKQDILHIAICTVLEPFGYYEYSGIDEQGWPHFELKNHLPVLKPIEQEIIMRDAITSYFIENDYLTD